MDNYFRIEFDRVGFTYEHNPIGSRVCIEWEGQNVVGRVWSASYTPELGYYGIGVRLEPISLKEATLEKLANG